MPKAKGKPHPRNALSAARVRSETRPGMHADGLGLYLVVDPSGARRWVQKLVVRGKRREFGLGGWPGVSLQAARAKALANYPIARSGGDPLEMKRRAAIPTFAEATERVIALNAAIWRHRKTAAQWKAHLQTYAFPFFGSRRVDQVSGEDVLAALAPIWTAKPETARRVKRRIGAVLKWGVAQGWRIDNPAGDPLTQVLPKLPKVVRHFTSLPYEQVPAALRAIRASGATAATRLLMEFQILTAVRPGEARESEWREIDLEARTWAISAGRMKSNRVHRVPLSGRALEVLAEAKALKDGSGLIFPSTHGRPLSDMTQRKLLRTLGIEALPHGFRSSFRNWAAEQTEAPHAAMEAALAHVVANATEAAYFRSDLFDRRRPLMDAWSDYVSGEPGGALQLEGSRVEWSVGAVEV